MKVSVLSNRPIVICGIVLSLAVVSAIGSDNPAITLACGFVTALTVGLLWRLAEAPVMLMPAGLQLSQVVMPVLYANLLGVSFQAVSPLHIDQTPAIWFALAAMLSLVLGLWLGHLGGRTPPAASMLLQEARSWNVQSAFAFCMAVYLVGVAFRVLGDVFQELRQALWVASSVQWLGVFVLATVCIAQRRGYGFLVFIVSLQAIIGFTGYFSEFKMVFFVVLVAVFSVHSKLRPRTILVGLVTASVVLVLGAFWSATKKEYRSFANGHSEKQVIVVPFEDRIGYLINRMGEFDWTTMSIGLDRLAKRWAYVDLLAVTMKNVPAHLPHMNGALIGAAVIHTIEPRFLFPGKPPLDDNQLTAQYAGLHLRDTTSSGTSIGLGYVAELYVDFGLPGTIVAMFVLGFLAGRCFRFVSSFPTLPAMFSGGLAVMLATSVTQFETSLTKTVGSFVMTMIVILVLRRFLLPTLLRLFAPSDLGLRRRIAMNRANSLATLPLSLKPK